MNLFSRHSSLHEIEHLTLIPSKLYPGYVKGAKDANVIDQNTWDYVLSPNTKCLQKENDGCTSCCQLPGALILESVPRSESEEILSLLLVGLLGYLQVS